MYIPLAWLFLAYLWRLASANVEKTIFLAPSFSPLPSDTGLDDLGLERLSPLTPVLRTYLNASFPTDDAPLGAESWYFLDNLTPGKRYEVRICYLATQPTSFSLSTHTLADTMEDAALFSSISRFSSSRLDSVRTDSIPRNKANPRTDPASLDAGPRSGSVLFLRIYTAADYFTPDDAMMQNVPPVLADVILDPFLLNVFPKSLVPTAGWIAVVAAVAVVISRWVVGEFKRLVKQADIPKEGKKKK